uniref:EF-hand domain-containing protein n=1 Tax=Trieres chinensis TaxID=1514140 RepID=A0A7S1Z4Q3_TRICV|mmetsp:Transcript_17129/g.35170  ORF Transcript_17129/g.35170 Transcript_17129/m.35170 type:complete len:124 (+) Transcript_17129:125-496(+)|eukprot:CAMPEP_0183307654 /NCGR_PEP_ID=MMETSP0160_2-20130417/18580_1 /TAXON_ID=2839 ORGANISM="Odontella Sinensis, Strain Grunow 1884" /NCGR_SAMPLE_ID=MMETSP0160_2 /ASSEMBLY_ACC=CAM_ASM_000250 /LENGTH=123 /DNA_ID=CAMNT_0025471285 /DNA_START=120 /DNA_END=491 /DNA_ORIENTATION=+
MLVIASSRFPALLASTCRAASLRPVASFSSDCAPVQKLRCIFEDYRKEHFSRETPKRFKKELFKAAINPDSKEVEVERINQLLKNIGHEEDCLSKDELDVLLDEANGAHDKRVIPVEKMMQLI